MGGVYTAMLDLSTLEIDALLDVMDKLETARDGLKALDALGLDGATVDEIDALLDEGNGLCEEYERLCKQDERLAYEEAVL